LIISDVCTQYRDESVPVQEHEINDKKNPILVIGLEDDKDSHRLGGEEKESPKEREVKRRRDIETSYGLVVYYKR
jgi:hypothetical protein